MKKKILSMILVITVLFMGMITVNAKETDNTSTDGNIQIEVIPKGSSPKEFFDNPSDVLNSSFRSTTKPTKYWNLASKDYTGNLIEVRASWLYTNYYFSPNNSGALNLDYNISPINMNGTKMKIGIYNKSTDKFVKYYTTGGVPTAACIRVTGLNKNQHYAFAFTAVRDPNAYNGIRGTIRVYH